ncbi:MAG: DUF433 domain-containing protein [Anaerolineae bacterium]
MSLVQTEYKHIVIDEDGIPTIAGTTMKVEELIAEMKGWGWGAEKLHEEHPYLSLGQIHAALAYYWDHTDEIDKALEDGLREYDEMRRAAGPSPLQARLKAMGLL